MQPGDVLLGKFRIERVLGRGGMGLVVAARHVELDELFAMKLMHPETLSNPEAIERFVREARAAARLKGEHVARVHDVGRLESGAPYMLMEHLAGDDLSGLLDKRGALPVREAAQYVLQACEAIAEAHGQGIVHRDLKPANLFLTARANGTPCIKVLDFGISKKIDPATKFGPTLTVTGAFIGSPAFMSPEQMLNGKSVDTRSDIWALGAILYELTTGALPFNGETMTELVAKVMNEPAVPPSVLRRDIPHAFDDVVLTCLQKRPARRYQTIDDLMMALRPFAVNDRVESVKAISAKGLPRIEEDPDSERSTRIVNPPKKALPHEALPRLDNGPDSEQATRKLNPAPRPSNHYKLPSAVDTDFRTTSGHTVEMTTQVRQPSVPPKIDSAASDSTAARPTPPKSKLIFLGLASLAVIASVALAVTFTGEETPKQADANVQTSVAPTAPENTAMPIAVQPVVSSQAGNPVPTTSINSGAGTKGASNPNLTITPISSSASTSATSTRKGKAKLY